MCIYTQGSIEPFVFSAVTSKTIKANQRKNFLIYSLIFSANGFLYFFTVVGQYVRIVNDVLDILYSMYYGIRIQAIKS
jgi:hypothetical protein